ncbi:MAG TPA: DUF167 family protein [Gammaproteobacteria bacterium]|jgi:uncharacterized protein (TIGR00251 family)
MSDPWRWEDGDLLLRLHVQPRASRDEIAGVHGDALKVRITAPPVDGKANAHLVRYLADEFGVPAGAVELVAGATGRRKLFRIRAPRRLPAEIPR